MKTVLVLALGLGFATCLGALTPDEKLRRVDETFLVDPISFDMTITAFDAGKTSDTYGISGVSRMFASVNKTLVFFREPERIAGRRMLMDANYVHMLFPNTSNPVRLTPLQVLLGDASNGDVARTAFSVNYDVVNLSTDLEGGKTETYQLKIKAEKAGFTYPRAVLVVDAGSFTPVSADFSNEAGKVLKKVVYSDFRPVEGKLFPHLLTLKDPSKPDHSTTLQYTRVQRKTVPENRFKREFLERLTLIGLNP